MAIDAARLQARFFAPQVYRCARRDSMRDALRVGSGHDPLDIAQMRYGCEGEDEQALQSRVLHASTSADRSCNSLRATGAERQIVVIDNACAEIAGSVSRTPRASITLQEITP